MRLRRLRLVPTLAAVASVVKIAEFVAPWFSNAIPMLEPKRMEQIGSLATGFALLALVVMVSKLQNAMDFKLEAFAAESERKVAGKMVEASALIAELQPLRDVMAEAKTSANWKAEMVEKLSKKMEKK